MGVTTDYNSIDVLRGLSGIRKKLGMYLGSTSSVDGKKMPKAITQIIQELLSNALDEAAIKDDSSYIDLKINADTNEITIKDEGRGMPKGPEDSFSEVINALTIPHSSGKFDQKAYGSLGTAGMHGIGIKAVNAASKTIEIEAITFATYEENGQIQTNHKKKIKYNIKFEQDNVIFKKQKEVPKDTPTYTKIYAKLDDGTLDEETNQPVFEDLFWKKDEIENLLELNTALVPKGIINFIFIKDNEEYSKVFESKDGLLSYAKKILNDDSDDYIHYSSEMFEYNGKLFQYDVVFKANENHGEIHSYANTVPTPRGGSHQEAVQDALVEAIQNYAKQTEMINKTLKKRIIVNTLDILTHAQVDNSIVTFEGQTKDVLSTPLANFAIKNHAKDTLLDSLYDNEEKANKIVEIIIENEKLEKAKDKTEKAFKNASKKLSKKDKMKLSSKLKEASSKNPAEKELFIVEGDSASNIGRDLKTQAVFPIRGKIRNVYDLSLSEALKNKEVSTIIATIGAGVGTEFDLDKMNYNKIIIAADADSDGYHISTLLIGLFARFFPEIITSGRLYKVEAPLYKIVRYVDGKQQIKMIYNETEMKKVNLTKDDDVDRYKGLGEMSIEEAHTALANPQTRRLIQLKTEDIKEIEKALSILIGDSIEERRDWAKQLDFA